MGLGKLPDADVEGDEGSLFAEINITPLTDIFLVLVIIVLAAASAQSKQAQKEIEEAQKQVVDDSSSGLKVDLPSGQTKDIDISAQSLVVAINKDGQMTINGVDVTDAGLENVFRMAYTKDQGTQVVLQADRGVPHGIVVGVMERAKQVGLSRVAIATNSGG